MEAHAETRRDAAGDGWQEAVPSRGACGIQHGGGCGDRCFRQRGAGEGSPLRHIPVFGTHQAHATATVSTAHQLERVEIVRASPQAPVKACDGAVGARANPTDHLTGRHFTTDWHLRYYRLVRGPEGAVVDHYHAAARDLSGEADRPGCRRAHRRTGTGSQVDPAVTGGPAQNRRPETSGDGG